MDSIVNVFSPRHPREPDQLYLNPRLDLTRQQQWREILIPHMQRHPDHYWLMSSGTESARLGKQKFVALSRDAILSAAQGVVDTFDLQSSDIYLKSIPSFHIGGLSIYARAQLAGFRVVESLNTPWSAALFCKIIQIENITVASLVPTQIYDLVEENLKAPPSLRWVFVGGGALSMALFEQARALGWPLVLTYGMTETSAMLAWQREYQGGAQRLPHILDWREVDGRLAFYSPALLTGYVFIDGQGESEWLDPKRNGWYHSEDCGHIVDDRLHLRGRASELVKILGETVSLHEMQNLWEDFLFQRQGQQESLILALPQSRLGHELILVHVGTFEKNLISEFNKSLLPFQKLRGWCEVPHLPRNTMGKVLRQELLEIVARNHQLI